MALVVLQKEWLDKCEQAKRMKLMDDKAVDTPGNNKGSKGEKVTVPSRSMSLDSNTLGMFGNSDGSDNAFDGTNLMKRNKTK